MGDPWALLRNTSVDPNYSNSFATGREGLPWLLMHILWGKVV
jgi:hypothetical protein